MCHVRWQRETLDIPIIVVTARKEDIDQIRGFDRGADDYIEKPFNPNELVARVKANISRYHRLIQRECEPLDIQLRELVIDRKSRRVFMQGEEKVLTVKEYDLLVLLATHPDQVFRKYDLFERIWGIDSIGDISTVVVHIRRIRKKIEEDPSKPKFIETLWGVGDRFKKMKDWLELDDAAKRLFRVVSKCHQKLVRGSGESNSDLQRKTI